MTDFDALNDFQGRRIVIAANEAAKYPAPAQDKPIGISVHTWLQAGSTAPLGYGRRPTGESCPYRGVRSIEK
jgi:hypothetical protein